jgi:hypothetical protein
MVLWWVTVGQLVCSGQWCLPLACDMQSGVVTLPMADACHAQRISALHRGAGLQKRLIGFGPTQPIQS